MCTSLCSALGRESRASASPFQLETVWVLHSCGGVQGLLLPWESVGVRVEGQSTDGGGCLLAATVRREPAVFTLISSSETVRTSSTKSLMMGHVFGPMLVLTASAMVSGG